LVIPIDNVKLKTTNALAGLKDFNPKEQYRHYEGMRRMTSRETQMEMGLISNLITDMTVKGAASEDEFCRAVKHSMVVIDAEKHYLNYKQSAIDNRIAELKEKYQGGPKAGAATLISRAGSGVRIPQRQEKLPSKMTPEELAAYREGRLVYENTGRTYQKKQELPSGEVRYTEKTSLQEVPRMSLHEDAYELVSGTPSNTTRIERVYADYANGMKALANEARKLSRMEVDVPYSPSAKVVYANEYASLMAQLNIAKKNAPLERQAQLIANAIVRQKKYDNPDMDDEHLKRLKGMELDNARRKVGAKKKSIVITDREWEAINAGAITKTFLRTILNNADLTRIRELATPRANHGMSAGKVALAKQMLANKHTQADVAEALGVSVSTLIKSIGVAHY
jgi:hypothetical protein